MGEAKRRGTFEQRKNSAPERLNENTEEVISKMIEFGIYEKSLETDNSCLIHESYIFVWKNGEYAYLYSENLKEINSFLEKYVEILKT